MSVQQSHIFHSTDEAVISGSLSWESALENGRTAARLLLTLTLDRSYYPDINSTHVGVATIPIPGVLKFGDGSNADQSDRLEVVAVDESSGYIVAIATILHQYPAAHHYGNPWMAEFEYCCRRRTLLNNQLTRYVHCRSICTHVLRNESIG